MTNTANIRFEPSNVAYVAVDLDTHEMTGGVMDETTGTFYAVGGGGGASYHKLTMHLVNSDPDYYLEGMIPAYIYEKDGNLVLNGSEISIAPSGSIDIDFLYTYWEAEGEDGYNFNLNSFLNNNEIDSVDDETNCTYGYGIIAITDATEDASITVNAIGGMR